MVEYILAAGGKRGGISFYQRAWTCNPQPCNKVYRTLSAKDICPEFDYEAIRARRKQLMKEHIEKNGIEKKPDVDEILDYLRSKNIKTAVATATDPERTKQYLTQIGIYDKFDQLVSATTVENGKPEPDVYLYACEQIGEKPKDCIAVEDSPNGIIICIPRGLSVVRCRISQNRTRRQQNFCMQNLIHSPD